jgi:hypothetical protein
MTDDSFAKWFTGSKATTPDGRPIPLYRGVARFGRDRREGVVYFTPDRRLAEIYAADRCAGTTDQTKMLTVYLAIKNPAGDRDLRDVAARNGIVLEDARFPAGGLESNAALVEALKSAGFDGVIGTDGDMEGPPKPTVVYVAFDARLQVHVAEET